MQMTKEGNGAVQIILVPGGPGLSPDFYAELTAPLTKKAEVITYLQSGTVPTDSTDFPRTLQEYAQELEEVCTETATERPQVLMGHSFGVPVVIEALLNRPTPGGAILLNGFDSHRMFVEGVAERRRNLPPAFHASYEALEPESMGDILPLLGEYFYPRHFCRLDPWPQSFLDALSSVNMDLLSHWIGTDFFEFNGALRGWDRSEYLGHIDIPALVVSGAYDYYKEDDSRRLAAELPKGEVWISESASHTPWVEDPARFFPVVDAFLRTLS